MGHDVTFMLEMYYEMKVHHSTYSCFKIWAGLRHRTKPMSIQDLIGRGQPVNTLVIVLGVLQYWTLRLNFNISAK